MAHYIRKVSIKIVACACTISPTTDSICLMDCWSMGPIKDWYIHYEKAGDKFVGHSVTGIYSRTTEIGGHLVHWYWTDSPVVSKYDMESLIEDNFVRRKDMSSPTFAILQFLFACVWFHYTNVDAHIHKNHRWRESPIFISAGREKKYIQVWSYKISLDEHNIHSLLYWNTSACHVDAGDRIIEGYFWTADKR